MSLAQGAVELLTSWSAPTSAQEELRQDFLAQLGETEQAISRHNFPAHLTASTIVFNARLDSVLLTLHAKAQRWFQFGGHIESQDATLADAAKREAIEESGIASLQLNPDPVQLSIHPVKFCHPRGTVEHFDVRFLARTTAQEVPAISPESKDVAWFRVNELPTQDPDICDLIDLAQQRLIKAGW